MTEPTVNIVTALIALFASILAVFINWKKTKEIEQLKLFQALQLEYDKDLRTRRIESYMDLCKRMIVLAKYPRPESLSYTDLEDLALSFRDWYFNGGGLIASETTRDHYFDLQDGLKIILQKHANQWPTAQINNVAALTKYLQRDEKRSMPTDVVAIANSVLPEDGDSLPEQLASRLRTLGSVLRTRMTEDVLTRLDTALKHASLKS